LESLPFGVEAFEYLSGAVVIVDDKSNVLFLNKSAAKLYHVAKEEVLGGKLENLFVEEWFSPEDKKALNTSLNEKGYWFGESFHVKRNGHKFYALSSLTVFHDPLGRKRGITFLIHQIDESKKLNVDADTDERFRVKLDSVLSPDVEFNRQELTNLIDAQALQSMMDDLYAVTKIGFAVIDLKGNVLAATGWQDICTKFHRVNPQTIWNCLESDLVLSKGVARGEFRTYKCKNNMWDIVTPIVIGNKHVGNLFSGQFFFDDETIDRDLFAKQAEKYGFDKEAYLSALDNVPRWNRAVVRNLMQFYVKLSEMTSKLSYSNLKLTKSLSDQKLIEKELRKSQHDLNHAQKVAKTGSWRLDVHHNELIWSEETYRIFGIQKGTPLKYQNFLEAIYPQDRAMVDQSWKSALRGVKYDVEHRILVDGNIVWVHEKAELEFNAEGLLIGGFGTVQDITERKIDEHKLRRLNRALRAISNSNQALMRATDEAAFLQQGCRIIIEDCGYTLVWIGFALDDENKTVSPMAYAGFDKGYIDALKITWTDTERGNGPTGCAIRTGKPQICQDMRTDPCFAPWRKKAVERGYVSMIALPLMSQGKAFGSLNIYSHEPNPFSEDEVKLLVELASDFAHGIILLRMRKDTEQAQVELLRAKEAWERTFDAVPDMIAILDEKHRVVQVNRAMAERLGVKPEQCVGLPCFECVHGTKQPPEFCPHMQTLKDGQQHVEKVFEERLGGYLLVSTTPLKDAQGKVIGSVHVARNLTQPQNPANHEADYSLS
jgi:PAS domain S-box-containing protein